jgi:hypothetical protein
LDRLGEILEGLALRSVYRQTGDSHQMASPRFSALLALEITIGISGQLDVVGVELVPTRTDSNSNRKKRLGGTMSILLNGQNCLSRNDGWMMGEWYALKNEKRYWPS